MQRHAKVVLKSVVFSENKIGVRTEIVCDTSDESENESEHEYNSSSSDSDSESSSAKIAPLTNPFNSNYPVQILDGECASDESSCSSFRSCSPSTTTAVPNIVNIASIKSKLASLEKKLLSTLAKTQRGFDALYDCPTLPTQRIGD